MKVIVVDNNKQKKNKELEYRLNRVLEWLIYMFGYAIVLIIASNIFKSLYIKDFWIGLLAAVVIYVLNKTLKPILVQISLPLIGMSLGLFYFVINVVILLLADLILGKYFQLTGFFSPIIVSLFISIVNVIMDELIIKPLIERCKNKYEIRI